MHRNAFEKHWSYIILQLQYLTRLIQMIINCKKRFCRFLIFSFSKNFAPVDYWGYRNPSLNFFELWLDLKKKLHGLKPWRKEEFIWGYHSVSKTLLCWKFKFDMLGSSRHLSVNKDLTLYSQDIQPSFFILSTVQSFEIFA